MIATTWMPNETNHETCYSEGNTLHKKDTKTVEKLPQGRMEFCKLAIVNPCIFLFGLSTTPHHTKAMINKRIVVRAVNLSSVSVAWFRLPRTEENLIACLPVMRIGAITFHEVLFVATPDFVHQGIVAYN
ncbi:hypothetical protein E4U21_007018 [Claviceps maximensis]|nr:hypothetical protein E4U21_007018 [Claviceps maximensis]